VRWIIDGGVVGVYVGAGLLMEKLKEKLMEQTETIQSVKLKDNKRRILSNTLIVFMVAMVFANIASEMYMTMLPLYLKYLGADVMQVGVFFTVSQIVPLILQVLGGWVSDTIGRLKSGGRKKILMIGFTPFLST